MRHKIAIMVAVVVFQLIMIWAAELLVRRGCSSCSNGHLSTKKHRFQAYITRNPNDLPSFYERFSTSRLGVVCTLDNAGTKHGAC